MVKLEMDEKCRSLFTKYFEQIKAIEILQEFDKMKKTKGNKNI